MIQTGKIQNIKKLLIDSQKETDPKKTSGNVEKSRRYLYG